MTNYLQQILSYYRNLTLNSVGMSRDLYRLLQDKDISKALSLMQNNDKEVDEAIKEYNPQSHDVMRRPNKYRERGDVYITEKLPRSRQRYINEVELFFLLGKPMIFKKSGGEDEAYSMFVNFLKEQHFNSRIRQIKRLAGAETESALLYHIYRDDDTGERKVKSLVLARSTGYKLRPLIDQYGNMSAFAYGYTTREGGRSVEHWDFQTSKILAYAKKSTIGWDVEIYANPTGKINVIYFHQPKAWEGVEPRIRREEMLDSKTGDVNNYFADPIATATADVIDSMVDPNKPGKLIQLAGEKSRFEYINPPQSSQTRELEKEDLQTSILFDTLTPNFDFKEMRGLGTLSGAAIRNAMILGYIKRDIRSETYDELIVRHNNVVIGILKYLHPDKVHLLDELDIKHEFAEPFIDDKQSQWQSIVSLFQAGLMSLESAIAMLALTDAPEDEIKRLKAAKTEDANNDNPIQATTPRSESKPLDDGAGEDGKSGEKVSDT